MLLHHAIQSGKSKRLGTRLQCILDICNIHNTQAQPKMIKTKKRIPYFMCLLLLMREAAYGNFSINLKVAISACLWTSVIMPFFFYSHWLARYSVGIKYRDLAHMN